MGVRSEDYWAFRPGDRVRVVEGFNGQVTDVQDGPYPGTEKYIVALDNAMGGGQYSANELSRASNSEVTSNSHTAADDYPELGDILERRPNHKTVMTAASVLASTRDLELMESDQGYGSPIDKSDREEYPHYCDVCDNWMEHTTQEHVDYDKTRHHAAEQESALQACDHYDEHPSMPHTCKNCLWAWGAHSAKAGGPTGHGSDPLHPTGAKNEQTYLMPPDFETEVTLDEDGERHIVDAILRANAAYVQGGWLTDKLLDHVVEHAPASYKQEPTPRTPGGHIGDWCRFRRPTGPEGHCYYPKELNESATKTMGYAVWIPEDRGICVRVSWDEQKQCPIGEPGPHVPGGFLDATVPFEQGGQHYSALSPEFGWHATAAWRDVQSKAKMLAHDGRVHIISTPGSNSTAIVANVQGDTDVYRTLIQRVPGKYAVALWECGCAWSSYSWGRTGRWKRYEGRMCSHALALTYEAQRREMFGADMKADTERPSWWDSTQMPKTVYDKVKQRSVASLQRGEWVVDARLVEPPITEMARAMLEEGGTPTQTYAFIQATGTKNADIIIAAALKGSFWAKVRGRLLKVVDMIGGAIHLDNGDVVSPSEVLYPTYDPHLGLSLSDRKHGARSDPCPACSGTGEQGTGHECYACDGSGQLDAYDASIDNANPENGLLVGRNDAAGVEPVTAADRCHPGESREECDRRHEREESGHGYGHPFGYLAIPCTACGGSGCGHCAGTGNEPAPSSTAPAATTQVTSSSHQIYYVHRDSAGTALVRHTYDGNGSTFHYYDRGRRDWVEDNSWAKIPIKGSTGATQVSPEEAEQVRAQLEREGTPPANKTSLLAMVTDAQHPEAKAHGERLEQSYLNVEPRITPLVKGVARRLGGDTRGLRFRIKGFIERGPKGDQQGLVRDGRTIASKIERVMRAKGVDAQRAAGSINDALRYTVTFPEGRYAQGVEELLSDLKEAGHTPQLGGAKNYWKQGDPYDGINITMNGPGGVKWELQAHTPKSFAVKQRNHADYEAYEKETNPAKRKDLYDRMSGRSSEITQPRGARDISRHLFHDVFDAGPVLQHAAAKADYDGPTCSGVVLKAADTGRILMLQRNLDDKDEASGQWEFPGGHHEEGDKTSLHAGIREWEEEVGHRFPEGGHVSHVWRSPNGIYQGHVVVVPSEDVVELHKTPTVKNPDGDLFEQSAWWDPDHARKNPALRDVVKSSPWNEIKKAAVIAVYDDEVHLRCDHCGHEIDNREQELRTDGVVYYPDEECPYCDHGTLRKTSARQYVCDQGHFDCATREGGSCTAGRGKVTCPDCGASVNAAQWQAHERKHQKTSRYLTIDEARAASGVETEAAARALLNQAYRDQGDEWLFENGGPLQHTAAVDVPWLNSRADIIATMLGMDRERLQPIVDDIITRHVEAAKRYRLNCDHAVDGGHRVLDTQKNQSVGSFPSHNKAVQMARSLNEEHEDRQAHPNEYRADLHEFPEPALPQTDGVEPDAYTGDTPRAEPGHPPLLQGDTYLSSEAAVPVTAGSTQLPAMTAEYGDVVAQFQANAAHLNPRSGDSGRNDNTYNGESIASVAQRFLKEGLKAFTPGERKQIIDEGLDVVAGNFDALDLSGTHYESLEQALQSQDAVKELFR